MANNQHDRTDRATAIYEAQRDLLTADFRFPLRDAFSSEDGNRSLQQMWAVQVGALALRDHLLAGYLKVAPEVASRVAQQLQDLSWDLEGLNLDPEEADQQAQLISREIDELLFPN